jgi:hypothetical protein
MTFMTDVKQQDNALQPTKRSSKEYTNNSTVMPNWLSNLVNTCPHPAIIRSMIKIAPASNKSKCLPCFDSRTYMTRMLEVAKMHAQPIFQLTRRYLDMYFFSIAEVLLEQNVDPG